MKVLIESTQRVGLRVAAGLAAAITGGVIAAVWFDSGLPGGVRIAIAGIGGALAISFGYAAWILGRAHGGLVLDEAGGRLGLGLTHPEDTWWIPLASLSRVRVDVRATGGGGRLLSAALEAIGHPPIVLIESDDDEIPGEIARAIAKTLDLPVADLSTPDDGDAGPSDLSELPDTGPIGPLPLSVRGRAALQGVLAAFGVALTVVGVALSLQVETLPAVALFVGPVMALLGLAFAGVVAARQLGTDELTRDGDVWTHRFRVGSFVLSERTLRASEPRWRLRLQALRGASLELVADDAVLVLGSGTTTHSRASVSDLSHFARRFGDSHVPSLGERSPRKDGDPEKP